MGILLIVLGLAAGAVVADFMVENHLATAPALGFKLFGNHWHLSVPALVLAGVALRAAAVVLLALGFSMFGRRVGRRRTARAERRDLEGRMTSLQGRTAQLHAENAALAEENTRLKSRLDAVELDALKTRLDTSGAETLPPQPADTLPRRSRRRPDKEPPLPARSGRRTRGGYAGRWPVGRADLTGLRLC